MPGRNAKPVGLHLAEGNPNRLTKAEIERRQKSEIKFGDRTLRCPTFVKDDAVAYAKWREVVKLYAGVDFVASGDVGLLARYCMTWSEYHTLLKSDSRLRQIKFDGDGLDDYIENNEEFSFKAKKQLRDLFNIHAIMAIESAINQKAGMLIKMEDRLFLNPLSKVKNVPKKEEKKEDPLTTAGFGDI